MSKEVREYTCAQEDGVSEIAGSYKLAINNEVRSEIWVVNISVNDKLWRAICIEILNTNIELGVGEPWWSCRHETRMVLVFWGEHVGIYDEGY